MLAVKGRMAVSIHLNVAAEDPEDFLVMWDKTSQQKSNKTQFLVNKAFAKVRYAYGLFAHLAKELHEKRKAFHTMSKL